MAVLMANDYNEFKKILKVWFGFYEEGEEHV
jgi:hypothetical protein